MSSEEYFDWADDVEEMVEQQERAAAQAALSRLGDGALPSASSESSETEEFSAMSSPATTISMGFPEPELCDGQADVGILENALDLAFPRDQCVYEKLSESDGPFGWLDPDSWDSDTLREYFLATDGSEEVGGCEMTKSDIPATDSQLEADTGAAGLVYPYHHLNFYNCPVQHRSNTPAAISLWVALHAKKLGKAVEEIELYRGVNRRHVIASQAGKHIDAVAYDGPEDVLDNFSGSALVERVGSHCRKVYQPYGNWVLEEPFPNEERPSCTDDEPYFIHGWNHSGPPFPCHASQVADTTNINDDGRLHEADRNCRKLLVGMSPLWQYESADGEVNWPEPPRVHISNHKHHANKPDHPDVVIQTRVSSFKALESLDSSLGLADEAVVNVPANEEDPEDDAGELYQESVDQDSDQGDNIHGDPSHIELDQEEQTSADISSLEAPVLDVPCNSQTSNADSDTDDAYFYSPTSSEATTPPPVSSSFDDASWVDEAMDEAEEQKRILDHQLELIERNIEIPSIAQILATLRQSYLPTIVITPPEDDIGEVKQFSPIATGIESDYLPTITVTPPKDSIGELEQLSPMTAGIESEALATEPVTAFDDLLTEALKQIMDNDVLKKLEPEMSAGPKIAPRSLHDGFVCATTERGLSTTLSAPLDNAETSRENQSNHIEYEDLEDIPLKPSFNEFLFGTSTIAIGHKAMELGTSIYQKILKW